MTRAFKDGSEPAETVLAVPVQDDMTATVRDVLYRRFPTEVHADLLRAAAAEIVARLTLIESEKEISHDCQVPDPSRR